MTDSKLRGDMAGMVVVALVAVALGAGLVWTWSENPELFKHAHFNRL